MSDTTPVQDEGEHGRSPQTSYNSGDIRKRIVMIVTKLRPESLVDEQDAKDAERFVYEIESLITRHTLAVLEEAEELTGHDLAAIKQRYEDKERTNHE